MEGKYPSVDIAQTSSILPLVMELWDGLQKAMQRFPPFLYRSAVATATSAAAPLDEGMG
jgi:hypothetical protein